MVASLGSGGEDRVYTYEVSAVDIFSTRHQTCDCEGRWQAVWHYLQEHLWHDIDVYVCGVLLGAHKPIEWCYRIYRCVLIAAVTTIT